MMVFGYYYVSDTTGVDIGAVNPSGVTDQNTSPRPTVTVFPNPVSNWLNITLQNNINNSDVAIEIFTATGKRIFQTQRTFSETIVINTADLIGPGIYLVKVRFDNETVVTKRVVLVDLD